MLFANYSIRCVDRLSTSLWSKWEKNYAEWNAKSTEFHHCVENVLANNICSISQIFERWVDVCLCQSRSNFLKNRFSNDRSIFFTLIDNIDKWFSVIKIYVDFEVLNLILVILYTSLFASDYLSFQVRERLKIVRETNTIFSKNDFASHSKFKESSSITSNSIWIFTSWQTWVFEVLIDSRRSVNNHTRKTIRERDYSSHSWRHVRDRRIS